MATLTFETYNGAPAWNALGVNTFVFSGSPTNLNTYIASGTFNYGTHIGTGLPGTDACGVNHCNNNMLIDSTHISVNGGASVVLSDANIPNNSCSFRLHFNDSHSYSVQNGRIYSYDGTTTTNPSSGVDAALYVKGNSMATWATLNSSTATGPAVAGMNFQVANVGGDKSGSQTFLFNQTAATDYFYYCCISVSPETPGGKSQFSLGAYIEYY